ncbi:hypothetical protein DFS34DRAFT_651406 [Phlyctochytrium arcticum]|nr:hypothetical protein DFS34DRAFT_651406 [Phlyctochytrium arcticum]
MTSAELATSAAVDIPENSISTSSPQPSQGKSALSWASLAQNTPLPVTPLTEIASPAAESETVASAAERESASPVPTNDSTASCFSAEGNSDQSPASPTEDEATRAESPSSASVKDGDLSGDKKPIVPAPAPAVNVWKVRLQVQQQKPNDPVVKAPAVKAAVVPQRNTEERRQKQVAKDKARKEQEDKDVADGFVKVQSKKGTKKRATKTPQPAAAPVAAPLPVTAKKVTTPKATAYEESRAAASTPTGEKSEASSPTPTITAETKEEESKAEVSVPASRGPVAAKIVQTAARSENLLAKDAAASRAANAKMGSEFWPTLGSAPTTPPRPSSAQNMASSSSDVAPKETQVPVASKKGAWAKLDVPIHYPPPNTNGARPNAGRSGKASGKRGDDSHQSPKHKSESNNTKEAAGSVSPNGSAGSRADANRTRPRVAKNIPGQPSLPAQQTAVNGRSPRRGSNASAHSVASSTSAQPTHHTTEPLANSHHHHGFVPTQPRGQRRGGVARGAPRLPRTTMNNRGPRPMYGGYNGGYQQSMNDGFAPAPYYGYVDPEDVDISTVKLWIRTQMEYYFSVENLCRDIYFRRQMNPKNGGVSIRTIANFNRVRSLINVAKAKCAFAPTIPVSPSTDKPSEHEVDAAGEGQQPAAVAVTTFVDVDSPTWLEETVSSALEGSELVDIIVDESGQKVIRRKENWEFWLLPVEQNTVPQPQPHHHHIPQQQTPPTTEQIKAHAATASA